MTQLRGVLPCLGMCLLPLPSTAAPVTQIGSFSFTVRSGGFNMQVPYDANLPLPGSHPQVRRAVVLLHGTGRNCRSACDNLLEAASIAGLNDGTSWLFAPQFLIEEDLDPHQVPADRLFWSEDGWKQGDPSLSTPTHPRPVQLSSFSVMDTILARMATQSPNLETLVLAGHSAGGQFINRFAAGSAVADQLRNTYGVEVTFVVANPSSYLYFDSKRVVLGTLHQFAVPSLATIQLCPSYNDYKYGLLARNAYMSRLTSAQITTRYRDARVPILLGENDVDPSDPQLDTSCAAMLQGPNRLERGRIYGFHLRSVFGSTNAGGHPTIVVPGVGHSSHDMFTSPCGVAQLFGTGNCQQVAVEPNTAVPVQEMLSLEGHPNPFKTEMTIAYRKSGGRRVTLGIYDTRGRLVRTLHNESTPDGFGSIVWDGRSDSGERVPAGVYFYRLRDQSGTLTRRAILLP